MALTDGIFGMVMTLLIFTISIHDVAITSYTSFISFICEIAPTVGMTMVSFILIAYLWIFLMNF